jgi:hypothetical protein
MVSAWVYEVMMTGKVNISSTKTYKDIQNENKNKELRIRYLESYLERKKRKKYKIGNCIYVVSDPRDKNQYKIGKTDNFQNRLSTYNTGCSDENGYIVHHIEYIQEMELAESTIFHRLKGHRVQNNKEWFDVDLEIIIKTIKEVGQFLM